MNRSVVVSEVIHGRPPGPSLESVPVAIFLLVCLKHSNGRPKFHIGLHILDFSLYSTKHCKGAFSLSLFCHLCS